MKNGPEKSELETITKLQKQQWLPHLIISWNLIDILVHIAVNQVEPLRVAGNLFGITIALIVYLKLIKSFAPYILVGGAILTIILNTVFALDNGVRVPMLIFIGVSVFMLLRLAQVTFATSQTKQYLQKRWCALITTSIGIGMVILAGL